MRSPVPPFELVHRRYRAKVRRYLAGIVRTDDADDLAQVTMMKVSERLSEFRGDSSLSTWIYRIATNVALDRVRQRSPELVPIGSGEEGEAAEAVAPSLQAPSAEDAAMREEMTACIREFVGRLPLHYRTVLALSEFEGFANAEIAQIVGTSLEAVKIRLHRARARLRAELRAGCTLDRDERDELACDRRPAGARK